MKSFGVAFTWLVFRLLPELLIPSIFILEFVVLGIMMRKNNVSYPAIEDFLEQPVSYPGVAANVTHNIPIFPVGYCPDNNYTRSIMESATIRWNLFNESSFLFSVPFASAEQLDKAYMNESFVGVGVIFHDPDFNQLNYTLRFPSEFVPPTSKPYIRTGDMSGCRPLSQTEIYNATPPVCPSYSYAFIGFAGLQNVISAAYTEIKGNLSNYKPLKLSTKMLPTAPTVFQSGGAAVASLPASYVAQLLGFYVIFLVIFVVTEKEKKHIESMKIMGLRASVYWLSWIFLYAGIMLIASLIIITLAKVLDIWPHSNFLLLLIDCMLFAASIIALGFCIAPLFRRPLIAGLITYALLQVFGFLYLVETFVPSLSRNARWGIAVLSPTAFFMTLARVGQAEAAGWGIGFGNAEDHTQFSFANAITMLAVDFCIYSVLALYLEKVFPSDDTPKLRPWFFLLPSFWCGHRGTIPSYSAHMTDLFQSGDVEPVPLELRAKTAVVINGLRKIYNSKSGAVAVDNFTYECYEGEILAILGHNGAGKTTIINMITGMIAPTAGNAMIYGKDVTKADELREARTMIGICPQHNVLFDTLTVREHILFYGRIKGYSGRAVETVYEGLVDDIGMRSQADVKAENLSGGQKRRLSIAIAAVGDPKVLILDEPTSGVDPFSQRFLWDMIRGYRKGRCIIITTQSMQEADVFADRKLIISQGRLRCAGTSLFLKNRFGQGYHLTMAVNKDYKEDEITEAVQSNVPGAEKTRSHAGELAYILPKDLITQFPALFHRLDENLSMYGIQGYGVSLTTMEEIFLKLAADQEELMDQKFAKQNGSPKSPRPYSRLGTATFVSPVKGAVSDWVKFWALCKVRFLLMIRSKLSIIFQFLIPFMLLVMNGILTVMASDYVSLLMSTDPLSMDEVSSDYIGKKAQLFFENDTEVNMDSVLKPIWTEGILVDAVNYSGLLSSGAHQAGYIFKNASSSGEVLAATIGYNSTSTHSIPFSINLLLNAIFRGITGKNETFHVSTHAWPAMVATPALILNFMFGSLLTSTAVVLIPGVYGIDVCRDRQIKTRSQIRMTGCSLWLYWGSAFFAHLVQFIASFGMIVALLYAFNVVSVTSAIGPVVALFALHAPTMVLFCYCLSFMFTKFETAAVGLPFPMATIAFILYFIVLMLDAFAIKVAAEVLHYVFAFLFPCYGFFGAMIFVQKISVENSLAFQRGVPQQGYFDWESNISVILVAHAIHIPLLILLLIYLESRFFNQSWLQFLGFHAKASSNQKFQEVRTLGTEDDDVIRERNQIKETNPYSDSTYAVLLRSLWKHFDVKSGSRVGGFLARSKALVMKKVAVRNLSMAFPKGEIFGLLGPNGAGKTTLLSMITGEITPTSGDVHVNGFDMHSQTLLALETMGSCPQTDTLWEDITMQEHLQLFAILNDLPSERQAESIATFTEGLYITEHLGKKAAALSGGTKRKLTFVISMIGNPPLVMLDEPSTGMDPQSKRNLWDMITESLRGQRGAILTTHSMEEADALCDRIGIIVKGELRCVGSSQHLKNKFGTGYLLEAKLNLPPGVSQEDQDAGIQKLKDEVNKLLPGASVLEAFYNRLVFAIPKERVSSLGNIFAGLEKMKQVMGLEEFSFSQTTIEQVFLHFAKMQDVPDLPHIHSVPSSFSINV